MQDDNQNVFGQLFGSSPVTPSVEEQLFNSASPSVEDQLFGSSLSEDLDDDDDDDEPYEEHSSVCSVEEQLFNSASPSVEEQLFVNPNATPAPEEVSVDETFKEDDVDDLLLTITTLLTPKVRPEINITFSIENVFFN